MRRWQGGALVVTADRAVVRAECRNAAPSALALEIDVHELCHAIAALQPMDDPCHLDHGGVIQAAATAAAPRRR